MSLTDNSKIVILISGSGSNLQSIIDAIANNRIDGNIVAVISNKPNAYGLQRASAAGIPTIVVDHTKYALRENFDEALAARITQFDPDCIVLAGFMRILSEGFVNRFLGKMLNIHPSLLPKYPGLHTHQRAIDNMDKEHGTSIHFVTPQLDGGPVILQAKVPVFDDDDSNSLAQRVLQQEHQIYPLVIGWACDRRLLLKQNKAWLDGQCLPENGYAND